MTHRWSLLPVLAFTLLVPACGSAAHLEPPAEPEAPAPAPKPWAKRIGGAGSTWTWDASLGSDGRLVVTGGTAGTATFEEGTPGEQVLEVSVGCDAFVAHYAREGDLRWVRALQGDSYVILSQAAFDDTGHVVLAGYFASTLVLGPGAEDEVVLTGPGMENAFLARLDPEGRVLWARVLPSDSWAEALGLVVFPDGAFVVAGAFGVTVTVAAGEPQETILEAGYDGSTFLAGYHADGTLAWTRVAQAADGAYALPVALAADPEGGTFVAGEFLGTVAFGAGEAGACELSAGEDGASGAYVARFAADGNLHWARAIRATAWAYGAAVDVSPDGCYRVGGSFAGTLHLGEGEAARELTSRGKADGFMAGWFADGTFGCAVQLGGENHDAVVALRTLPDHTAYVLGTFRGTAVVEREGEVAAELSSVGLADVVLLRCDAENCVEEARSIGGEGMDKGFGLDAAPNGSVVLTGSFEGVLVLAGPEPLVLEGSDEPDAFVVQLALGPEQP